jgi:hypothetical protein
LMSYFVAMSFSFARCAITVGEFERIGFTASVMLAVAVLQHAWTAVRNFDFC